jgi:acetyltransferase-like isoleucine patch superfamily enzyme
MNTIQISDLTFKVFDRLRDLFFLYFKWKLLFRKIGKKSFVKKGVKVIGNPRRIEVGRNFKIWENCTLGVGKGKIIIGDDGLLGVNSLINSSEGTVKIGNNVVIAPYTQIYSYSHHFEKDKLVTDCYKVGNVTIENNVLIGSNVIILPNVTIHEGAIIAAGAVVTTDIPSYKIYAGIPAKEIGTRQ